MQTIDHSYYFVPKKTGGHYKPVVQSLGYHSYPIHHYVTDFAPSQGSPRVTFSPTVETSYKSKISFLTTTQRSNVSTTTTETTSATTSDTITATISGTTSATNLETSTVSSRATLPPLLPAFHPDYRPASYHRPRPRQGGRHKKHVPWTSYSLGNSVVPSVLREKTDYTPDVYVTPIPLTEVSTVEAQNVDVENSTSASSESLILATTELLANMTNFRTLETRTETDAETPAGDDEKEVTATEVADSDLVTTWQSIVESDQFLNVDEDIKPLEETDTDEDITINPLEDIVETATKIEKIDQETNENLSTKNISVIDDELKP